jgi:hypothetical protein
MTYMLRPVKKTTAMAAGVARPTEERRSPVGPSTVAADRGEVSNFTCAYLTTLRPHKFSPRPHRV